MCACLYKAIINHSQQLSIMNLGGGTHFSSPKLNDLPQPSGFITVSYDISFHESSEQFCCPEENFRCYFSSTQPRVSMLSPILLSTACYVWVGRRDGDRCLCADPVCCFPEPASPGSYLPQERWNQLTPLLVFQLNIYIYREFLPNFIYWVFFSTLNPGYQSLTY